MNKIKNSRTASFVVIALIYIMATVMGVVVYHALAFDWWISLLIADMAATVLTFVFSLIFQNASVYDPYWSVQPPLRACLPSAMGMLTEKNRIVFARAPDAKYQELGAAKITAKATPHHISISPR